MTYAKQLDRERREILAAFCDTSRHLSDDEARQMGARLEAIASERARILTQIPPLRRKRRPADHGEG